MTVRLTTTDDVKECPQCAGAVTSTGLNDRQCNTCGLVWTVVTEADELDAEADRLVRSRGYSEDRGRSRKIGRFQSRW